MPDESPEPRPESRPQLRKTASRRHASTGLAAARWRFRASAIARRSTAISLCALACSGLSLAGESDVVAVKADCRNTTCDFAVTVRHDDTGWEHYADHWRILTPDGVELGRRVLAHPHENEQPFTRQLRGVEIGLDITEVIVESHDSEHEYGGATQTVVLER